MKFAQIKTIQGALMIKKCCNPGECKERQKGNTCRNLDYCRCQRIVGGCEPKDDVWCQSCPISEHGKQVLSKLEEEQISPETRMDR